MNPLNPFQLTEALAPANPLGMGAHFVANLSEAARYAIPFINEGVRLGLPASNILSTLRDRGIGIGRNEGLGLVRATRSAMAAGRIQTALHGDEVPEVSDITATKYYTAKRYTYTVGLNVVYDVTGATGEEFINISSDSPLSNNELAEALDNIMVNSAADYAFSVVHSWVDSVVVDPRFAP